MTLDLLCIRMHMNSSISCLIESWRKSRRRGRLLGNLLETIVRPLYFSRIPAHVFIIVSTSVITIESKANTTSSGSNSNSGQDASLVHKLFEGVLTSETRCLTCETVLIIMLSVTCHVLNLVPLTTGVFARRVFFRSLYRYRAKC
jgi:hypothetical protein